MPQEKGKSKPFVGWSLGKYKVTNSVGDRALYWLVKCQNPDLAKEVSGKILNPSPCLDYFLARSKKISTLDHPNIVPIYEIGFVSEIDRYYIVEESYDTDLAQVLQQNSAYAIEDCLPVLLQVTQALAYAHSQGVVHGNLIPESLMLDEANNIRVGGWGLVNASEQTAASKPLFGVPGYMAPELFTAIVPNYSTDIYSLGCTFYQMLTNTVPLADAQDSSKFKGTTYRPPELSMKDIPDSVASLLKQMLANDPDKRINKASDVLTQLESLFALFYKATCPRCGKKNSAKEIFTCRSCNTANLCLSHLVTEEQKCDHCVSSSQAMVTQQVVKPSAENRLKLSDFLLHLANNNKYGILVLGSRRATMALNIQTDYLEICLEKMPADQVYKKFGSSPSPAKEQLPSLHAKIVKAHLAQILEWKEFAFEFWEDKPLEKVVPQNKTRFGFAAKAASFLKGFAHVLRLINDMTTTGGLSLAGAGKSAGVLFGDKGIFVFEPGPGNNAGKTLRNHAEIETLLKTLLVPDCQDAQYRSATAFPPANIPSLPPQMPFLLESLGDSPWENCGDLIVPLDRLLPATENWEQPLGGMDLKQLSQKVRQQIMAVLTPESFHKAFAVSSLNAVLFTATLIRHKLAEVGQTLVEMVENHTENWGEARSEQLLLEAQKLCPDMAAVADHLAEICNMRKDYRKMAFYLAQTGDIYWMNGNFKEALPYYEKAVQLNAQPLEPRVRLVQLYTNLDAKELTAEMRDKVETLGNGIITAWQQQKDRPLDLLEKICLGMLKVNGNQIACHRELIKLYLGRNDRQAVIAEYETLGKIFSQDKNRDAAARCYATILSLDPQRNDMKDKLKKMGYEKWQTLVEKVQPYRPPLEIKIDPKMVKMLVRLGGALAGIILLFVGWLVFFAGEPQPAPVNEPVQPTESPAQRIRREAKEKWEISKDLILLTQKSGDWQKTTELCKTTMAEFAKTYLNKEAEKFCNNVLAEVEKAMDQELSALWKKLEELRVGNNIAQAQEVCMQIIAKGNEAWQKKARQAGEEMQQQVIQGRQRQFLQQKTYDEAVHLQKQGKWQEAIKLYYEVERIDGKSALASSAKGAREWLQEMELKAKKMVAEAETKERSQRYGEAVAIYQAILADPALRYTDVAQKIMLPLWIETEPVTAKCFSRQQELGDTPLVFRYRPGPIPEITTKRAGFSEISRNFTRTANEHVWKLSISLQYRPLWVVQTGGPIEAPLLLDANTIYVGSRDGNMYAIAQDGKRRWSFNAGTLADIGGGALVDDSQVYFGSYRGDFYALDRSSGRQRWKLSLGSPVRCTPCWAGSHICVASENGILSVVNTQGKIEWQLNLQDKCYASPVSWERKAVFVAAGQKFYAISAAKRQALWQTNIKGQVRGGPLLEQKHLYYTTSANQVCKQALNGQKAWEIVVPGNLSEALYVAGERVFVGDKNGIVYCLENASGKVVWQQDTATVTSSGAITPALLATDNIVIASNSGRRFVVLAKNTGNILWDYEFSEALSGRAVFSQGILYVGTEKGQIYACLLDDVLK